jgi:hypothetical protein
MKHFKALLLLLLMLLPFASSADEKRGEIKFDTTFHDFGKINAESGTVSFNFEFENVGDGNLVILDAKTPCGCTRPSYPKSPIKPGKRDKVKITFDPKGRYGSFSKSVTIYLDNCKKKRAVLKISGTVLQKVRWLDKEYDFGVFHEEDGVQIGKARFVNVGAETLTVRKVTTSCGCTAADYSDGAILPGDTACISFRYNPEDRPGSFSKKVKVYLNDDKDPDLITIKGTVIGAESSLRKQYSLIGEKMALAKDTLDLGKVELGYAGYQTLTGYNRTKLPLKITALCESEQLNVVLSDSLAGPGEPFTLSFYFTSRTMLEPADLLIPVIISAEGIAEELRCFVRVRVCKASQEVANANLL